MLLADCYRCRFLEHNFVTPNEYTCVDIMIRFFFFFQAEGGIRDSSVTGVQTCALPIYHGHQQGIAALAPVQDTGHAAAAPGSDQRGNALLVSMIMLLLVLLLAVVGMRVATLEARIAANMVDSQRLYETADGTLRESERKLLEHAVALKPCNGAGTPVADGSRIPCSVSDGRTDSIGLGTDFQTTKSKAAGFQKPDGYWYPRYITTDRKSVV